MIFNNKIKSSSIAKLLWADDLYYNFSLMQIVSPSNSSFFIKYEPPIIGKVGGRMMSFLLKIDDAAISFKVSETYDVEMMHDIKEAGKRGEKPIITINEVGSEIWVGFMNLVENSDEEGAYEKTRTILDELRICHPPQFVGFDDDYYRDHDVTYYPQYQFDNEKQLSEIKKVFKQAMTTFPSDLERHYDLVLENNSLLQVEPIMGVGYGVEIEFSEQLSCDVHKWFGKKNELKVRTREDIYNITPIAYEKQNRNILKALLASDDFYYDLDLKEILSPNNPKFYFKYNPVRHGREEDFMPYFTLHTSEFMVQFNVAETDETRKIYDAIKDTYTKDGFTTFPITNIEDYFSEKFWISKECYFPQRYRQQHVESMRDCSWIDKGDIVEAQNEPLLKYKYITDEFIIFSEEYKFRNKEQQGDVISLLEKVMTFFPVSLDYDHELRFGDGVLEDIEYGSKIEIAKSLATKLESGHFIYDANT